MKSLQKFHGNTSKESYRFSKAQRGNQKFRGFTFQYVGPSMYMYPKIQQQKETCTYPLKENLILGTDLRTVWGPIMRAPKWRLLLVNSVHWNRTGTLDRIFNPNSILLPPVNFGSWQVEKYGNKSKIIHRLCTNPGGDIPLWIVELANKKYLPQMLLDLETYASEN